jgi:hypothetical protein
MTFFIQDFNSGGSLGLEYSTSRGGGIYVYADFPTGQFTFDGPRANATVGAGDRPTFVGAGFRVDF